MTPTDPPPPPAELPPRLRRILELVYQIEGVAGARVWQWSGKIAIGVRPTPTSSSTTILYRVQTALAPLREPEEQWEFGLLEDT
jgi:hypothetical protein